MNKRILRILIGLTVSIMLLLVGLYGKYQAETKPKTNYIRVVKVHDGDTVSVILDGKREKVRLIGIDAPELGQRPWGQKAKRHLRELLSSSKWEVSLEFDIEKRDIHGRLLSYLWTPDKKMINLQVLKDGYAVLFTIPPNIRYVDELRKAQSEARDNGLGIWARGGLSEAPREYRKEHPRL
jgi:micrococcal nuclease